MFLAKESVVRNGEHAPGTHTVARSPERNLAARCETWLHRAAMQSSHTDKARSEKSCRTERSVHYRPTSCDDNGKEHTGAAGRGQLWQNALSVFAPCFGLHTGFDLSSPSLSLSLLLPLGLLCFPHSQPHFHPAQTESRCPLFPPTSSPSFPVLHLVPLGQQKCCGTTAVAALISIALSSSLCVASADDEPSPWTAMRRSALCGRRGVTCS